MRKLLNKLGIDGAISYSVLGKIVASFTAVFTVYFLARYLSKEAQGYYYTFASLLGIQVFFELGLNNVIAQFVAHEFSYCSISADNRIEGSLEHKSRLASLLQFCVKWYSWFSVLFLVSLIIAGIFFFSKFEDVSASVEWKMPWVLLVLSSVLNFLLSPVNSFLQGLKYVKQVAIIRFYQYLITPLAIYGGLMMGWALYVCAVNLFLNIAINIVFFYRMGFVALLKSIWVSLGKFKVDYMKEIFPYQWKIALSWISGYFIYQLFNPILFASEGAVEAGRMGMTISAASAIQSILLSWINTKIPLMSDLIEKKSYSELDSIFFRTLKQICFLSLVFFSIFAAAIFVLQKYQIVLAGADFGERFIAFAPTVFICIAFIIQIPVNAWATYLRCHLQEPLLANSIAMGVLSCFSAFVFGNLYGTIGLSIGYSGVQIISAVWVYIVFRDKRAEWHKQ